MKVTNPLKPIYNHKSRILILGTMPSITSRQKAFYYAHPTNRFWPVMESLFKVRLSSPAAKTKFLLKNKIALWDIIKECEITASSDASIKNIIPNDIDVLIKHSQIKTIFTEGKKADSILRRYFEIGPDIEIISLPSPSSANAAFSLERLINVYEIILHKLK